MKALKKETNMVTLILVLVAGAGGFVAGILVGRRNKDKVEATVRKTEAVVEALKK